MEKIVLEGFANDLLYDGGNFKTIKLIKCCEDCNSDIALELSSFNEEGKHDILDKFLDQKIEISIKVIS